MTKGIIKDAERTALNVLDKWNNTANVVEPHTGYYYELQAVIEDAVHIGIQAALFGTVRLDDDGNVPKIEVLK